jgi:ABC-type spermidine/putrescine transport system permease subunit II
VSVIATTVGVLGAYAYVHAPMRRREPYYLLITLPLYVPGAVLGLGISVLFGGLSLFGYSLYGAKALIVAAHCMWALPLAFMIGGAALRNVEISVIEAAADLGASPLRSFLTVTLPLIETGVVSSAILAFVISLNEFPMALFLSNGDTRTLPS